MKKTILLFTAGFLATFLVQAQDKVVHIGETIILNNSCSGFDCSLTESYGHDTHRYRESNLRIHFDDNTSSGSFPRNDWRFIFNDTNNGGDEYFAVQDATANRQIFRVDAAAPLNGMRLFSNGHLGLGTDNAQQDIHIVSGDMPSIRFEQDTSDSQVEQTWEISADESEFMVRDQSAGETVPFRIAHKASSNSLVIDSAGNIGIGTIEPGFRLQVAGDADFTGELTAASDRRLKRNIHSLDAALTQLRELNPVSYQFRDEEFPEMNLSSRDQMGLIAQEVEKVLPDLVVERTVARDSDGVEHHLKSVNYIQLIPLLIRGLQEQQNTIEMQAAQIQEILNDRNELKAMMNEIRTYLVEKDPTF